MVTPDVSCWLRVVRRALESGTDGISRPSHGAEGTSRTAIVDGSARQAEHIHGVVERQASADMRFGLRARR
jgi:hypothetical protein